MKSPVLRAVTLSSLLLWSLNSASAAAGDEVARGVYLAQAADCTACHTAPGGQAFAGGLPMTTPIGKVFTTNITPDTATGIGQYSEQDFARALRDGVAKDGRNLYPAMPYPSYVKLKDDDVAALYAYFMHGVAPVSQANKPTTMHWPLNMRWPLKLWNVVFLKKGSYQDKAEHDANWNRGAYLVQSLGHCGACHTPRGLAYNEKALDEKGKAYLSGAPLDGWYASDLTGSINAGLGRWSDQDLRTFFKSGASAHASAFGSMSDVINNSTQNLSDADIAAMTLYLKSLPARIDDKKPYAYDAKATLALLEKPAGNAGARLYATYCIGCHGGDGRAFAPFLAPLAGNPNVLEPNASSLVNVTLNGTHDLVIGGLPAAYPMPRYGTSLSDEEIAQILTFIRGAWNNDASAVTSKEVAKLRKSTRPEN
jgi:mono/diheme cytochrome c family protein